MSFRYLLRVAGYRLRFRAWDSGLIPVRPLLLLSPQEQQQVTGGIRTLEMHANGVLRLWQQPLQARKNW
jgi:hypothetical protein